MNRTSLIQIDKAILRNKLIEQLSVRMKSIQQEIETYRAGSDLDEEDTMDPEDFSHQSEAGDMRRNFIAQLEQAEKELAIAQSLPIAKMDSIHAGALVVLDEMNVYISTAGKPIVLDNQSITCISTDAPLFRDLMGKNVGDKVLIGLAEQTIRSIR